MAAKADDDPTQYLDDEKLYGQELLSELQLSANDDNDESSYFNDAVYGQELEEQLSQIPESVFFASDDNPDLSQSAQPARSAESDRAAKYVEELKIQRQVEQMHAHFYRTQLADGYSAAKKPRLVIDGDGVASVQMDLNSGRVTQREAEPEPEPEPQPAPQRKENRKTGPEALPARAPVKPRGPKKPRKA